MLEPRTDDGLPDASSTSHSKPLVSDAAEYVPAQPLIERHSLSRADIDRILRERNQPAASSTEVAPPTETSSLGAPPLNAGSPFDLEALPPEIRESVLATISKNQGKIPPSSASAKITVVDDRQSSGGEALVQILDDNETIEVAVTEPAPKSAPPPTQVQQPAPEAPRTPSSGVAPVNSVAQRQAGATTPAPNQVRGSVQISPGSAKINFAPKAPQVKSPRSGGIPQVTNGKVGVPGIQSGQSFRTGPVRVASTSGQTMVYFRPGNQPPAAVKVDEKSNTVRVRSVPPSVAKKIEDKLAVRAADARAPQVGPVKERGQVATIPADTNLHSAPVHPKAPPSPLQAEGSGDAPDPESAARREDAAKELIVDPATEMEARSGGHKSGGSTRSAHKAGKAIPAGSKGGGKRGKYKKPPVVTKPVLLFGVCAAALVCGMIWHSKSKQSVTQAIPMSHLATNAVPLADDADGLPQADTPVPQPKKRNARLSASKPVVDRASLPPMPPQNDNIWKITPKPSPIVRPSSKPSDGGASLPGRPSAALPTGSDALPKGMVPASAVSAQIPQPEVTADLHSVTVRGVKMYVPTDGSAGNLDNLGIDTDFAEAVRLGEGKGGCETSVSSPQ